MSYQSHLKSSSSILTKNVNNNKTATLGQIRERQIKEGSLWSKSYENIHSNANISTSLPLKPIHQNNTNINMNTIPDKEAIIIGITTTTTTTTSTTTTDTYSTTTTITTTI